MSAWLINFIDRLFRRKRIFIVGKLMAKQI
jgi:hypothetical protein